MMMRNIAPNELNGCHIHFFTSTTDLPAVFRCLVEMAAGVFTCAQPFVGRLMRPENSAVANALYSKMLHEYSFCAISSSSRIIIWQKSGPVR